VFGILRNLFITKSPNISVRSSIKGGPKIYGVCSVTSMSLPCLVEIYDMFYFEGSKVIPENIELY
jgi:hypothetical protein